MTPSFVLITCGNCGLGRGLVRQFLEQENHIIIAAVRDPIGQAPVPNAAYGLFKCMLNWYGARINAEDEWLNTFILGSGFTRTEGATKVLARSAWKRPP
ncbi:hypothetical protein LY78DRAFT_696813 [Colletotrichum sublineola]|nr:hypothetical protein LY78DRAFT_696813 [Colletotrichum sublineola]